MPPHNQVWADGCFGSFTKVYPYHFTLRQRNISDEAVCATSEALKFARCLMIACQYWVSCHDFLSLATKKRKKQIWWCSICSPGSKMSLIHFYSLTFCAPQLGRCSCCFNPFKAMKRQTLLHRFCSNPWSHGFCNHKILLTAMHI